MTTAVVVRRERPGDVEAVAIVHGRAFGRADRATPVEVELLAALRDSAAWIPELSLVAELRVRASGQAGGQAARSGGSGESGEVLGTVVGHVVCTRAHVGPEREALGLGPIGVLPSFQRHGLGHALMHAVVAAAEARGEPLIALLGDPAFYGRFGFVSASRLGIDAPDPDWGEHFMARALAAYEPTLVGPFRYAPPFEGL